MRIYISVDMEGITGLVDADDVQPGGRDYERGRALMAEDVNAAVRGALTAGATGILVNDAHGPMRNLLPEALHPAARLVRGRPKQLGMLEGLTGEYDAALCVGYHSRAGAPGVLSHSFMGHEIEDMWLDGRPVGEIGLAHATAAALGVPVVALTGDDAACAEMTEWDASVVTVPVKYARDRFAAELRPQAEAREAIEEAVARALSQDPPRPAPSAAEATLTVRWQSTSVAATLLGIPGVTAEDPRTVRARGELPALYRQFGVWMRVAASLTNQPPYC
ncbi:D-aminopeptidase DppA [Streptomyces olivaceoviridis]|uniref:M55 family metallopeptidase n=1 Tax=Streptomyces olivaceoviridis TaxID=1921 RepID=UPI001672B906|nr:M55 family metallopeptidase [Streptomyces olivaceoviridis]GGY90249.1 D-aminopeptidase DppA [Streptomyces olivaceoviridis]